MNIQNASTFTISDTHNNTLSMLLVFKNKLNFSLTCPPLSFNQGRIYVPDSIQPDNMCKNSF